MEDDEITESEPVGESELAKRAEPAGSAALMRLGNPAESSAYSGAGTSPVTQEEADLLMAPFADDEHDIKPTGEVFVPQVHYRTRLSKVWRPGGWAMVPLSTIQARLGKYNRITFMQMWGMRVNDRFVGGAVGENDYDPNNANMSEATAIEGVKSNALVRICKDLSIGAECWDKRWCEQWKEKHARKVWCVNIGKNPATKGKRQTFWRRNDATIPFPWKEE
jgi:hypothetical protein